jgi:large subunit ribosomal protein L22
MTESTTKKAVSEVKASAKGIHISPRKIRLVANVVRKLPVNEALIQLDFQLKKASLPLKKLVDSAVANAHHNFQIEAERLYIKHLSVDGGPVFFRYTPRAQGRAFPIRKRTSHVNLVLGVSDKPIKQRPTSRVERTAEKEKEPVHIPPAEADVPESTERKSRFAFWKRNKKEGDRTQVPPKQDVKGKSYTSFDRRGNM